MAVSGNFSETVGALTLSANSTLDFSGFVGTLRFGSIASWAAGANLAIWNWNGTPKYNENSAPFSGGTRHVVFASNSGLNQYLDRISFYSGSGSGFVGNAFEDSFSQSGFTGTEIIAVPETETYFYAAALLAGIVIQYLRRRPKRKPLEGSASRMTQMFPRKTPNHSLTPPHHSSLPGKRGVSVTVRIPEFSCHQMIDFQA
jgi:hypothetical protein